MVSAAVESLAMAQAEFAELILENATDGLQQGVQDAHGQLIVGVAFEVTGNDVMFENDNVSVHLAAASLSRVGNLAVISTAKIHGDGMLGKLIQAYNGAAGFRPTCGTSVPARFGSWPVIYECAYAVDHAHQEWQ